MVKKTAERHLEDLALLKLVERSRESAAANAAVLWQPSPWLVDYFPSETDKYPPSPNPSVKRVTDPLDDPSPDAVDDRFTPGEGPPYVSVSLDDSPFGRPPSPKGKPLPAPPHFSSETWTPPAEGHPSCGECGQVLLHPESVALGLCARCRDAA